MDSSCSSWQHYSNLHANVAKSTLKNTQNVTELRYICKSTSFLWSNMARIAVDNKHRIGLLKTSDMGMYNVNVTFYFYYNYN